MENKYEYAFLKEQTQMADMYQKMITTVSLWGLWPIQCFKKKLLRAFSVKETNKKNSSFPLLSVGQKSDNTQRVFPQSRGPAIWFAWSSAQGECRAPGTKNGGSTVEVFICETLSFLLLSLSGPLMVLFICYVVLPWGAEPPMGLG